MLNIEHFDDEFCKGGLFALNSERKEVVKTLFFAAQSSIAEKKAKS